MCYFIEINLTKIEIEKRFGAKMPEDFQWKPAYFFSGFDYPRIPVVISQQPENFVPAYWGLVPSWIREESKAFEIRSKTLNARMESISEKPSFRKPFLSRRCLVPAHGFYEWHHAGTRKYPFYIALANDEPFLWQELLMNGPTPPPGSKYRPYQL
jgi:putative SOS response-associated peptidase YedK